MPLSLEAPAQEEWRALGPSHLPSQRVTRYQGENERRFLRDFASEDRRLLSAIYQTLISLYSELKPFYHDQGRSGEILQRFIASEKYPGLSNQMRYFGHATQASSSVPDCARAIHDLRGGAFQALSLRLELFSSSLETSPGAQIFFLVRDHLKIMRNCVADLDAERFAKDSARKAHAASLLVEKWSMAEFNAVARPVKVSVNCLYEGTLCESCLEFSTLDRVLYNLMNNAAEHTSDGKVYLSLLPIPEDKPEHVRFVIANAISPLHRNVLATAFPGDLTDLLRGGFTTGGHGLGTRISADFCAHAYGVEDFEEARNTGYFGAKLDRNFFVTWFHWPLENH